MLISFIIPVYNAEDYVKVCVNSILKQGKKDFEFEVILIDDGSTDASVNLCDELALDVRVTTFHRANAGVSATRNFGISQAQGDFICFVDADDYLLPYSFVAISKELQENKADYYLFPFVKEINAGVQEEQRYSNQGKVIDRETACKYFFLDGKNGPWSKLFKRSIIEKQHLQFNENLKIHEDVVFCMEYLENCMTVRYSIEPIYFYRYNGDGAVRKHKREYLDNYSIVYKRWVDFLMAHDLEEYREDLDSQFAFKYIITSAKLLKHGMQKRELNNCLNANRGYDILLKQKSTNIRHFMLNTLLRFRMFGLIALKVK